LFVRVEFHGYRCDSYSVCTPRPTANRHTSRSYQIGTACAGSNPAVRGVSNAADVPEWLRGLTRILR